MPSGPLFLKDKSPMRPCGLGVGPAYQDNSLSVQDRFSGRKLRITATRFVVDEF
jgi:hypothetical protein